MSIQRSEVARDATVLVGVAPSRLEHVVEIAAGLARDIHAQLVVAYVEINSALIEREPADRRNALSLDPPIDDEMRSVAIGIRGRVNAVVQSQVEWDLRVLGGDPAHALSRLADQLDVRLVVVGGVRKGISHEVEDLLSGSVAAALTRLQHRPVLVVPDRRRH